MISTCCYDEKQKTCVTYDIPTVNKVIFDSCLSNKCPVCHGELEYVWQVGEQPRCKILFRCKSCGVAIINQLGCSMSKITKLKKCNICKQNPIVETYTNKDRSYSMYAVKCCYCNMTKTEYYDSKEKAVDAWNKVLYYVV